MRVFTGVGRVQLLLIFLSSRDSNMDIVMAEESGLYICFMAATPVLSGSYEV
ncbi:MAG: hypothetical protein GX175_11075 [Halanaerobiaceae bacterium]|nr:hypothetical protein [Halanaerobiaceae bacterium]